MKKIMMLVCVLGFASAAYAQMGSPIWDAKIMGAGRDSSKSQTAQKASEKEAVKAAAKAAAAAKAEAEKTAKKAIAEKSANAEKNLALLANLKDANGKAVTGKDIKNRLDYMITQIGKINGSDFTAQSALYAVEDFASYVMSTTQADYLPMVKNLLSQVTCSVRTSERVSLAEAVEEVDDAALQAGNGIPSAGVKPEALAFFRSLK